MSALPFTVQDDIEAKERYAAQQRQQSGLSSCGSRRIRLLFILAILSLFSFVLASHFHASYAHMIVGEDLVVKDEQPKEPAKVEYKDSLEEVQLIEEEQEMIDMQHEENETPTLKQEIEQLIRQNTLIVFSKTYCPFSKNAKRLLNSFNLKEPLTVVEVDLRDDDYEVKMVLKEISGRDTFPNVFLNGKTIGGSDDLEALNQADQLEALLSQYQLLN
ncbi:thioredoxin-like protein [Blakeslea trispora]|nr:thioredoxin-like protein [Blakeslea trispora]